MSVFDSPLSSQQSEYDEDEGDYSVQNSQGTEVISIDDSDSDEKDEKEEEDSVEDKELVQDDKISALSDATRRKDLQEMQDKLDGVFSTNHTLCLLSNFIKSF